MLTERASGVLLHVSSLPSRGGIGDLGPAAYAFADFLARAKQQYWQVLPLTPTGYGNSPYSALSAFAGNPLFISIETLASQGWLDPSSRRGFAAGRRSGGFRTRGTGEASAAGAGGAPVCRTCGRGPEAALRGILPRQCILARRLRRIQHSPKTVWRRQLARVASRICPLRARCNVAVESGTCRGTAYREGDPVLLSGTMAMLSAATARNERSGSSETWRSSSTTTAPMSGCIPIFSSSTIRKKRFR